MQPKTPMELLVFCRHDLGLSLPGYPIPGHADPNAHTDDASTADEVSRAVLSWGAPFRKIETEWKGAASPGAFAVASGSIRPPEPRPDGVVLCSSTNLLRGDPSPVLAPGILGAPFAADFFADDVRWLKSQWT